MRATSKAVATTGVTLTTGTGGALTKFQAPGAGTGAHQGTFGQSINQAGDIAGYYVDAGNVSHGFLRTP